MEVCEVCGSLLVANDTQQRVDEHLMGKQHMGYARIRSFIEERKVRDAAYKSSLWTLVALFSDPFYG